MRLVRFSNEILTCVAPSTINGEYDEMTDIHEDKKFRVKEFCVTREGKTNNLVSPYYFKSGGTVIDWWSEDGED